MLLKSILLSNLVAFYLVFHAPLVSCEGSACFLNGSFVKYLPLMQSLNKIIEDQDVIDLQIIRFFSQVFLLSDYIIIAAACFFGIKWTFNKLIQYWGILSLIYVVYQLMN